MEQNIYQMKNGKQLEVNPAQFSQESDLQRLIAENPKLLSRSGDAPDLQFYLVSREFVVHNNEDRSMFLDHLVIDSEGTPVIVEVKHHNNSELRRTVVGQIIDYATQLSSLSTKDFKELFLSTNPDIELSMSPPDWWDTIDYNLKSEKFKLVIVADYIPPSLQAIIKFMDRNFETITVYGVELNLYNNSDAVILTSSTVENHTSSSIEKSTRRSSWTVPEVRNRIKNYHGSDVISSFERIIDFWSSLDGSKIIGGTGSKRCTLHFSYRGLNVFDLWEGNPFRFYIYKNDNLSLDDLKKIFNETLSAGIVYECDEMLGSDLGSLYSKENAECFITCMRNLISAIYS